MRTLRHGLVLAAFAGVAVFSTACTQSSSDGIAVTLDEWSVSLPSSQIDAGEVTFTATNDGSQVHEFEIFTVPDGVDPTALEVKDDTVDTAAAGMDVVDEVEDIAPSTSADLTVSLDPGTYAMICNLPTHYAQGMVTEFTVA